MTLKLRRTFFFHNFRIDYISLAVSFFWISHVPFTSNPIGRAGRPWAALSAPCRIPGCRRGCRRAPVPLPFGYRVGGRIRARILFLAGLVAAGQIAIAAAVAGPVWAATLAAGLLPRFSSSQAQVLAQRTLVWLSCLPARPPRRRRPGPPSAFWRRLCWRWRSGVPRRPPRCSSRRRWSDPEVETRQNQKNLVSLLFLPVRFFRLLWLLLADTFRRRRTRRRVCRTGGLRHAQCFCSNRIGRT
jgi:hypothetical protein